MSKFPAGISVCMIVKNEEASLERALASCAPWASEIVVNDTGSTDRTLEIARSFPLVRVIQSEWTQDFSHARNLSLRAARYSWCMMLDADNVVPEEQFPKLRALHSRPADRVLGYVLQDLMDGKPLGSQSIRFGIFPNREEIFFEGRIHEQVIFSASRLGMPCEDTDIVVWHTGYEDEDALKRKARRNLEIMALEPRIHETPFGDKQEGDCYWVLRNWAAAKAAYLRGFEFPGCREHYPDAYATLPVNIGRCAQKMRQFKEAEEWFVRGIEIDPKSVDAYYHMACLFRDLGRRAKAKELYLKVLSLGEVPVRLLTNQRLARMRSHNALFELALLEGSLPEAEARAEEFARAYPDLDIPQKCLARVRFAQAKEHFAQGNDQEAFDKLESAKPCLESRPDFCLLYGQTLALLGRLQEAQEWILQHPQNRELAKLMEIINL
jgi:glycosyltransferase involved in cell wall biosynthesis